jgi:hypothetical protein
MGVSAGWIGTSGTQNFSRHLGQRTTAPIGTGRFDRKRALHKGHVSRNLAMMIPLS